MSKVCQTPYMRCIAVPDEGQEMCPIHIKFPDYKASPAKAQRKAK